MELLMSHFRTMCLAILLSGGLAGCFDTSNKDQGTTQNPDNGSSIQMKKR
jgi:hypothetical protein